MKTVIFIFYLISTLFFLGAFSYLFAIKRPGVFPPKKILKKRAGTLAVAGTIVMLIAFMLSKF